MNLAKMIAMFRAFRAGAPLGDVAVPKVNAVGGGQVKPRTELLEVRIGRNVYRGERIVTGRHELRQELRYEHLRERDPNDYVVGDECFMRAIATLMMRDLVEQWKAQARRKPAKVERKGRRPRQRSGTAGPGDTGDRLLGGRRLSTQRS
jgi:hypothetical protein